VFIAKNKIMNSSEFLRKIQNGVRKFDNDALIILYSSRARGDFKSESDWDILVLLNGLVNENLKENIRDELFEIELETDQTISSIIQSRKKWNDLNVTPFYQNVEKEGVFL
jgi:predicted nucleotidyltransferase